MSTPILELRNITKWFGPEGHGVLAVDDCTVKVQKGEFICVVGPSGCGKSTLMTVAAGLDRPTRGEVLVEGKPAGPPGPKRSVVFQRFALFPSETVAQNIKFGLQMARVNAAEQERRLAEQLRIMGLEQFRDAYPNQLSGGMQQRVAIARALANDPAILLLDEPFGALDNQTRGLMQELLLQIWEADRKTVLFVTHDIEEAIFLASRCLVMTARPGRIKADVPIPLAHPRHYRMKAEPDFLDLKMRLTEEIREEAKKVA